MKTTIELPDALMRQIKLRAIRDGKKLKDMVADLLHKGLISPEADIASHRASYLSRDERSGLPVIRCQHAADRNHMLTPERVAEVLLDQETNWYEEASTLSR